MILCYYFRFRRSFTHSLTPTPDAKNVTKLTIKTIIQELNNPDFGVCHVVISGSNGR